MGWGRDIPTSIWDFLLCGKLKLSKLCRDPLFYYITINGSPEWLVSLISIDNLNNIEDLSDSKEF